jgi:hypothetical protein
VTQIGGVEVKIERPVIAESPLDRHESLPPQRRTRRFVCRGPWGQKFMIDYAR